MSADATEALDAALPDPVNVNVTGLVCPHCHEPMDWAGITRIRVEAALGEPPEIEITGIAKHGCRPVRR